MVWTAGKEHGIFTDKWKGGWGDYLAASFISIIGGGRGCAAERASLEQWRGTFDVESQKRAKGEYGKVAEFSNLDIDDFKRMFETAVSEHAGQCRGWRWEHHHTLTGLTWLEQPVVVWCT